MTTISVRLGDLIVSIEVEDVFARDPRHVANIKLGLIEWAKRNAR